MQYSKAREAYPNAEWPESNYRPLLDQMGRVLIEINELDYSGDSFVLFQSDIRREEGEIGVLIFGWGSCSGCDALQACESYEDLDKLIEEIEATIKWFPTIEEVRDYVINNEAQDFCFYSKDPSWLAFRAAIGIYTPWS